MRAPTIPMPLHWPKVILGLSRTHSQANMIAPATVNRRPSMMKGGSVSMANFIPRYVVPQKK